MLFHSPSAGLHRWGAQGPACLSLSKVGSLPSEGAQPSPGSALESPSASDPQHQLFFSILLPRAAEH